MNWDLLLAVIFYLVILVIFFLKREKFTVQGKVFIMLRTKLGLTWMDRLAKKFPKTLSALGYISIVVGFIGMAAMAGILVYETIKLFTIPGAPPGLAPVIPGVRVPGLPVLTFWHWIITIFLLACAHEFAHGVFARLNKVEVKSSGFAFLGPIPAAFVEPDEEEMNKRSRKAQLETFSAGAFVNIILAGVFLLVMMFVMAPLAGHYSSEGLPIVEVAANSPIAASGIAVNDRLLQVNGVTITNETDFKNALVDLAPDDTVTLVTNKDSYKITAVASKEDPAKGYLGLAIINSRFNAAEHPIFSWFNLLVLWLFALNLGVGLFNLLPLGPIDGGRMLLVGLTSFMSEDKARKIHIGVTVFLLMLLVINLLPWLGKLFNFIVG